MDFESHQLTHEPAVPTSAPSPLRPASGFEQATSERHAPGPGSGGANPLLAKLPAAEGESGDDGWGFGDTADLVASGFSSAKDGMDLVHGASSAKNATMALGGTFGSVFEGLAAGADVYEGIDDAAHGKTARGVAEMGKGGAGLVSAGAEMYSTAADAFKAGSPEMKEFYEAKSLGGDIVSNGASSVANGILGFMDISDGRDEYRNGKGVDAKSGGVTKIAKGAVESGAAVAEAGMAATGAESVAWGADVMKVLGTGAPSALGVVGPALGSLATGLQMGHAMEGITKNSGLYKDGQGHNENGSDISSKWSERAAEWADPSSIGPDGTVHEGGQSAGAKILGGVTSLVTSPVAAAMDVAGTADSAYNWIKQKI